MTMFAAFVFISSISCTPGKVMTKDSNAKQDKESIGQEDKYDYNDEYIANNEYKDEKVLKDDRRDFDSGKATLEETAETDNYSTRPYNDRQVSDSSGDKFYQKGLASWYGREFQGSITASGERFDMNKLTAAHRSLPFGTKLLVKNLENGQSVRVIVNDRGPYREGRILDLSHAAARKLDMVTKGEANIGIILIGKTAGNNSRKKDKMEPVAGETADKNSDYYNEYSDKESYIDDNNNENNLLIQAGAFYSRKNAEKVKNQIEEITGNSATIVHEDYLYKVRVEGLNSRSEAEKYRNKLLKKDIPAYIIENRE
jgi:rare lipoprotein A